MRGRFLLIVGSTLAAACSPATPDKPRAEPPPIVRIARVGSVTGAASVSGVGTVALRRESSLAFTSAGRIARMDVDEGDTVRTGQQLAALDTTTVAADLASAHAERARAAAELRRSETLMAQGWITRPRLESARAALLVADARVSAAGFQRGAAVIAAPGPGVVLARLAEPGQVVAAGTPVVMLGEATSGFILRVPLSDRDAARLARGAPAQVTLAALGDETLIGSVVEIAGRADRATGTFAVEIALPPDPRLRSGQIGDTTITARGGVSSLNVPTAALFAARAGEAFVFVIDPASRRARLRRVTLAEVGESVRVTAGLRPGDWVATSRVDRLKDGMRVTPAGLR